MKKIILALIATLLIPFGNAFAGYGSAIFSENKDIDNIVRVVNGIQIFYEKRPDFIDAEYISLKHFWSASSSLPTKKDIEKFEIITANDNQIAVIKYKVKDCNALKDIKNELVTYAKVEPSTYMDCDANEFIIVLEKN
jgi:hypothetical protein